MRDPNRMSPLLQELAVYWMRYPDLRLGQLVSNFATGDVFYMEDDVLLGRLQRANAEGRPLSEADLQRID